MGRDFSDLTAAERFQRTPRPLEFVRPRFHLDIARYLSRLLADEREAELENLTELRTAGKDEEDTEVAETVQNLRWVISAEKEINRGLIELVGPEK